MLPKSDAFAKVEQARDEWLKGGSMDALAKTASAWSTQEWIRFVDSLPRKMEPGRLRRLDRRFTLTESMNSEIAHVWYPAGDRESLHGRLSSDGALHDSSDDEADRAALS